MPTNVNATLRRALLELKSERERVAQQIAAIQAVLDGSDRRRGRRRASRARGRRGRRRMSAAARKAVSQRMKAYWAKRKAGGARARGSAK